MVAIIDVKSALDKLTLHGLSSRSSGTGRKASFDRLAKFRDGGVFAAKFAGETPWERHPSGDELVHIVEGAATFHILANDGPQSYALSAGMVVVVPQGQWHRFESLGGVSLISATPLPTENATVADPNSLPRG